MDQPRQEEQQSAPCGLPEERFSHVSWMVFLHWTVLCNARLKWDLAVPVKKKDSGRLCLCKFLQKKSSCPPDCPLLRYHICIHGLPQGSMALGKSCDLTHDQNMSKYISWWRSYHSNVCRGIFKRSYSKVYLNRLVPV